MSDKELVHAFLEDNGIFALPFSKRLAAAAKAVARIPWGEGRTIEDVLSTKKVGTCTGKHLVLQACLDELNIEYRPVVCTFYWGAQGISFPEDLKAILAEGEWVHGHNFLQIKKGKDRWMGVDVTWNPELAPYGFRTFPMSWNGKKSFIGLERIISRWDGVDMQEKKSELIGSLTPEARQRRERFLKGFISWVGSINSVARPV